MWSCSLRKKKSPFGIKMKIVYFILKLIENASNVAYRNLQSIFFVAKPFLADGWLASSGEAITGAEGHPRAHAWLGAVLKQGANKSKRKTEIYCVSVCHLLPEGKLKLVCKCFSLTQFAFLKVIYSVSHAST